ncbi:MAG: inositol monophosphatase family protein [Bacilli bacterium]
MDKIKDFFDLVERNQKITIFGHLYPDGDCYGSTEGLKAALSYFYPKKEVYVIGTDYRNGLNRFPLADTVSDETIADSLIIVCDLANKARVGDPRAFSIKGKGMVKFDHHIFVEEFGGLEYVDEEASSSCDLIANLLYSKFDRLPELAANLFFIGLVTDSGRFQFSLKPQTLEIGARLLRDGADSEYIYNNLYVVGEKSLKFEGYLISNYKKTFWGTAYGLLDKETLKKYGYTAPSGARFVNSIGHINSSRIYCLIAEKEDGTCAVELRSIGNINVQEIAKSFGGGGHFNASGCIIDSLEKADEVVLKCDEALIASFGEYAELLKAMVDVAQRASKEIMKYYKEGFDVEIKSDNSPVTTADKAANEIIVNTLRAKFPNIGMLTEEAIDNKERLNKEDIFVIDPLDGTADFVQKDDMFAINIALVHDHHPVVGVVCIPASGTYYFAVKGHGSYVVTDESMIKRIRVSNKTQDITVLSSLCHPNSRIKDVCENNSAIKELKLVGSSLKACLVAEGKAEVNYTFGANTKEWDTCAPQIIVEEAGGIYRDTKGESIYYNREDVYNRSGFVVLNKEENDFLKTK